MVVLVDSDVPEKATACVSRWCAFPRRVLGFFFGSGPRHLWAISLALLIATAIWAYCDPYVEWAILGSELIPRLILAEEVSSMSTTDWEGTFSEVGWRSGFFKGLFYGNLFLILLLVVGVICGPKPYRSLKSLMMLTTLGCIWIGLIMSISNISWYGKQARVSRFLSSFEPLVAELNTGWPQQDGRSPTLGPYKAYPLKKPTTLILLTSPPLTESGMRLTSVIRTDTGALRFLLAGSELGDWLEWHPQGSKPAPLIPDGFQMNRNVLRTTDLGGGWHLVRYGL